MSEIAATVDTCTHPKITFWANGAEGNVYCQCKECSKEIAVPITRIYMDEDRYYGPGDEARRVAQQRVENIMSRAFGDQWCQKLQPDTDQAKGET